MIETRPVHLQKKDAAEVYYHLGRSSQDREEWKEAICYYQKALALDPTLSAACNDLGTIFQNQGKTQEAIHWYQQALSINPSLAEAWYNLGNVHKDQKAWEEASLCSRRALALDPLLAEAHNNLGIALYHKDQIEEAIICWRKSIDLKADYVSAYVNLGTALGRLKCLDEAIQTFQKALALSPDQALLWLNLGNIRKEQGEIEEAVVCYRKAIKIDPTIAEAYMNLGSLAMEQGHLDGAILFYHKAIELNPRSAETCYNLGNVYKDKKEMETAIDFYLKAVHLRPDYQHAFNNLALILHGQGQFEESTRFFYQALEPNPDIPEVRNNLGNVFKDQKKMDQALEQYRKAVLLDPDYPEGHWNLALALLMSGCLEEGWPEYEWRWKIKGVKRRDDLGRPFWDGMDLEGKRILIYAEQGFGDTIQFFRYVPLVAGRGGRVVLECQPELVSLLAPMKGIEAIVQHGNPLPDFDVQCPMLSLPFIFQTNLSTIPAPIPYIYLEPESVRKWQNRLSLDKTQCKVGLVWAGKPDHSNDQNRSLFFDQLQPLIQVPGISFYSLQKGEAARQVQDLPRGLKWVDLSKELHDFKETGAALQNLDLMITVDTAVAHLAGALGRPVWTILPYAPDWRWLLDREDTPWYPTMRLFRQPAFKDWSGVIHEVATCLKNLFPSE
jgi:tetratricopeptide (TPR) repeat protein